MVAWAFAGHHRQALDLHVHGRALVLRPLQLVHGVDLRLQGVDDDFAAPQLLLVRFPDHGLHLGEASAGIHARKDPHALTSSGVIDLPNQYLDLSMVARVSSCSRSTRDTA